MSKKFLEKIWKSAFEVQVSICEGDWLYSIGNTLPQPTCEASNQMTGVNLVELRFTRCGSRQWADTRAAHFSLCSSDLSISANPFIQQLFIRYRYVPGTVLGTSTLCPMPHYSSAVHCHGMAMVWGWQLILKLKFQGKYTQQRKQIRPWLYSAQISYF